MHRGALAGMYTIPHVVPLCLPSSAGQLALALAITTLLGPMETQKHIYHPPSPVSFRCNLIYQINRSRKLKIKALRGIEWGELGFPDVNILVHVNVNVPEEVWSHALKAT